MSDLSAEVTDAIFGGVVEAVAQAHEDGRRPTDVFINSESLDMVVSQVCRHAAVGGEGTSLFGLRLGLDDTLRLGAVRVESR